MQWHVDADGCCKVARPHTAAQHDIVGDHVALLGCHASNFPVIVIDCSDFAVLNYLYAAFASTLGECLGNVDGVGIAVGRNMNAADYVVGVQEWHPVAYLLLRQYVDLEVEYLGHRCAALQFLEAFFVLLQWRSIHFGGIRSACPVSSSRSW